MTRCLGLRLVLLLLLCAGMLRPGSGLSCYNCKDNTGASCENVQQCTNEDSCISLKDQGGTTVRQCLRYTDCNFISLSALFPSTQFTFRCCTTNLCNSGNTVAKATPVLTLVALLLSIWWCWI